MLVTIRHKSQLSVSYNVSMHFDSVTQCIPFILFKSSYWYFFLCADNDS